mmetsp:Transcript_99987/g.173483  ORF Transcript_99987/g.173483 Transcript_99987/m.173483 type:complete len:425 (-) Transcript_99987:222-1496(-)
MGRRWGRGSDGTNSADVASASLVSEQKHRLSKFQKVADAPRREDNSSGSMPHGSTSLDVSDPIAKATTRNAGLFKVWWIEKGGQRHEKSLRLDDPLPTLELSEAAAEYQLRVRAFWLQTQGMGKERIAQELGKAPGWVSLWWKKPPNEVERPRDVPPYVAEYNLRMLECGVEPFRPVVLLRRYMTDTAGLYLECAQQMPWRQAVFRKRNYQTGEVTVTNIPSSRQDCSYRSLRTGISRLDTALNRIRHDFNITDPGAYLLNNFYPDGNTSIAPHQHDFWSAILSFGATRVFTLDGTPILLGEGDLLVFGTQRHGVPKMPAVKDGRVSVAIFWYPEKRQECLPALDGSSCFQCGLATEILQEAEDGNYYCEECWLDWQKHASERIGRNTGDASGHISVVDANTDDMSVADDDLLAAALELSLADY